MREKKTTAIHNTCECVLLSGDSFSHTHSRARERTDIIQWRAHKTHANFHVSNNSFFLQCFIRYIGFKFDFVQCKFDSLQFNLVQMHRRGANVFPSMQRFPFPRCLSTAHTMYSKSTSRMRMKPKLNSSMYSSARHISPPVIMTWANGRETAVSRFLLNFFWKNRKEKKNCAESLMCFLCDVISYLLMKRFTIT